MVMIGSVGNQLVNWWLNKSFS